MDDKQPRQIGSLGADLRLSSRLAKHPAIEANLRFSLEALRGLRESLSRALGDATPQSPCVSVSGSLARLEGSSQSDVDYMIIYPETPPADAGKFRERVEQALAEFTMPDAQGERRPLGSPNPKGVFQGDIAAADLRDRIGEGREPYENIANRMLLVLESQPLWNAGYFGAFRDELIAQYAHGVESDASKQFVLLINDLIRYFRMICVNYHATREIDFGKWPIRNIKLRHSRIVMYMSLLAAIGELSRPEHCAAGDGRAKIEALKAYVAMPPLERFVHIYDACRDDNLFRLLGLYNVFLQKISDPQARRELAKLEYKDRYANPLFAELKSNSDAFSAEITRFIFARRGQWSDRFFEYILL